MPIQFLLQWLQAVWVHKRVAYGALFIDALHQINVETNVASGTAAPRAVACFVEMLCNKYIAMHKVTTWANFINTHEAGNTIIEPKAHSLKLT